MKGIIIGEESGGKTYRLMCHFHDNVLRNEALFQRYAIRRPIVHNLPLSTLAYELAESHGVELQRWTSIDQLPTLTGADLYIDEISAYFDARLWELLSLDVRRWLPQAAKVGVDIYGVCQNWEQLEVSYRRLTNQVIEMRKVLGTERPGPGRPPRNMSFALFAEWEYAPRNGELGEAAWKFPRFFDRRIGALYDTNARIKSAHNAPLSHIERECAECGHKKTLHV